VVEQVVQYLVVAEILDLHQEDHKDSAKVVDNNLLGQIDLEIEAQEDTGQEQQKEEWVILDLHQEDHKGLGKVVDNNLPHILQDGQIKD
jgi:hypothetical protein